MNFPYTLAKPITRGNGDTITHVVAIREAEGTDLLLVDQFGEKPMRLTMELIAAMAKLPEGQGALTYAEVLRMGARDIDALGESVFGQLPDGQKAGQTA